MKKFWIVLIVLALTLIGCAARAPAPGTPPAGSEGRGAILSPGEGAIYKFKDRPGVPVTLICAFGYFGKINGVHKFKGITSVRPPQEMPCDSRQGQNVPQIALPIMAQHDLTRQWIPTDKQYFVIFNIYEMGGDKIKMVPVELTDKRPKGEEI